jgi:hypothetical protein
MATSASQTYIAKLGFQDKDRGNARHGLACEYLFERLLELEVAPCLLAMRKQSLRQEIDFRNRAIANGAGYYHTSSDLKQFEAGLPELYASLENLALMPVLDELRNNQKVGQCINVPITSRSYVNGFADVLVSHWEEYHRNSEHIKWLGEVKIAKEPAENVLQQVNFYLSYLDKVRTVYILTDYDPSDLQRLCVGTKIKVFRLGLRFTEWVNTRPDHHTDEL